MPTTSYKRAIYDIVSFFLQENAFSTIRLHFLSADSYLYFYIDPGLDQQA